MSSSGLDWRPLLAAWLLKRPHTSEIEILRQSFEESFAPIYQWSRQNLHYVMDVLEFNVINQVYLYKFLFEIKVLQIYEIFMPIVQIQKALCLLEGLIPNEENEHKESTYERSASAAALLPDVPLDVPELTLDLKGIF